MPVPVPVLPAGPVLSPWGPHPRARGGPRSPPPGEMRSLGRPMERGADVGDRTSRAGQRFSAVTAGRLGVCLGMLSPGLGSEGPAQAPPCDTAPPLTFWAWARGYLPGGDLGRPGGGEQEACGALSEMGCEDISEL